MHMLLRILVPGVDEDDALGAATSALDTLTGIGEYASMVFDYYTTFDDDSSPSSGPNRFGEYPAAMSLRSKQGREFLDEGMQAQVSEFKQAMFRIRKNLASLSDEAIMDNVEQSRYDFYRVGQFEGPEIYVYDQWGAGIRSPGDLAEQIEREGAENLWVVPADVHH